MVESSIALLRVADNCLIWSHRLSEWTGHGPILEEDIALANIALDLLGQARTLLTHIGGQQSPPRSEDDLAYLRDEHEFRNATLVELPRTDYADTIIRHLFVSTWLLTLWRAARASSDELVRGLAGKAAKETSYHVRHATDWTLRLGDGTPESHQRMQSALQNLSPYTKEFFVDDPHDQSAADCLPLPSQLREPWLASVNAVLVEATLAPVAFTDFTPGGRSGKHSEHLSYLLHEMQALHRAHPGARW